MSLASKVRIDYFFDVLSPYAWIGFEALSRYQTVWNVDVRWRPFFLFGVLKKAENVGQLLQAPCKAQYMFAELPSLSAYYGIPLNAPPDPHEAIIKKGSISALRFLTILNEEKVDMVVPAAREMWLRRWSRNEDIHLGEHMLQQRNMSSISENLHPPSPAKRDYSRIDIARQLGYYGLKPSFPTSGVAAILAKGSITPLRFLTVLEMQAPNLMETGIREIYLRRWVRNEDIHQIEHIIEISRKIGIPFKEADDMVARIAHPDTKARLTETGNEAIESGAFGAPWINVHTTDGKMHSFWGSDRFHIIAHLIGEKFPGHMRDKAPKYD
uniref:Glutathione S-transferase kappa n=1 Tax=Plectus sambesii TaxID=2011161 RepID=A0A914WZW2_9BILA